MTDYIERIVRVLEQEMIAPRQRNYLAQAIYQALAPDLRKREPSEAQVEAGATAIYDYITTECGAIIKHSEALTVLDRTIRAMHDAGGER